MKLQIPLIVFMFLFNPVFADTVYLDKKTGFSFPTLIGTFTYSENREYGDSRLGYGLNYWSKDGVLITVIVYNLGVSNIQNGIDGSHVLSQYSQAQDDVIRAIKKGHYKSATEIQDLRCLAKITFTY